MAATAVLEPSVVETVVSLAERYAEAIMSALPEEDPTILRDGLTGALVSFFADAVLATQG